MKLAVRGFQAEHGLPETGRIGDATWALLTERDPLSTNWRRTDVPEALARARRAGAPLRGSRPPTPRAPLPPSLGLP
jgi:peptidoglycan hydrolase-like protein with peptidoglycan-binding domain